MFQTNNQAGFKLCHVPRTKAREPQPFSFYPGKVRMRPQTEYNPNCCFWCLSYIVI